MGWAELNGDILHLIIEKLSDVFDLVFFRAVCKNWRSVGPSHVSPQMPWFIELKYPSSEPMDSLHLNILCLNSNNIHTLHVPKFEGKRLIGPTSRYLLVHDYHNSSISLLNPLNGSYVHIPGILRDDVSVELFPIHIGPSHDPDLSPMESGNIAVFCVLEKDERSITSFVVFWRIDDAQLIRIVNLPYYWGSISFYKGRLFVSLHKCPQTRIIDITTGDELMLIPEPYFGFDYLIEACGDLLGVVRRTISSQWHFEVFQLGDGVNPQWSKISDIGDHMLFLGYCSSLCLKASDFDGFKGNCIYFTRWIEGEHLLIRYDLENKEIEVLPIDSECFGTWFVPILD